MIPRHLLMNNPKKISSTSTTPNKGLTLLRFGGRVGYAIRLVFTSLRSYSIVLMLPSVEWRQVGL